MLKTKIQPTLLVISGMRSGKDTFGEIMASEFGLKYTASSQAAADIFIFDELKDKYKYETVDDCFNDRFNHRAEWYNLICEYNKDDKARLAKEILKYSDAYIGMRDREEIAECIKQNLFDIVIWIDASDRVPLEGSDSFNIDKSCADIIIENNSDYKSFKDKVINFGNLIYR